MYRISYKELPDGSTGYAIYYVDYASAQEIVLCSDASCEHDSTDCIGIIQDDSLFSPSLYMGISCMFLIPMMILVPQLL